MVHVLVITNKDPLSGGIASILGRENDLRITNVNVTDKLALESVLEEIQPDTVVINECLFYAFPDTLLKWIKCFSKLRVIVPDENENLVHIYERKEVTIERALDFVTIVRGNQSLSG